MTFANSSEKFGDKFMINLTNEERKYLGLASLSPKWDTLVYHSKTNFWYNRVTAFFDGDIIIKVIRETKRVLDDGVVNYESYVEYDTRLVTDNRNLILPLTSRGKPKNLSASNITAPDPFGCEFYVVFQSDKDTSIGLNNPRANKVFPIGEWDAISAIHSEIDFHTFMKIYIDTCMEDYFDKLQKFKSAKKITVKYKPGDIFRMEFDRTHYCYGIITGDIKRLKAMPELPKRHSLRQLMMVPIMVRQYQLITDNPNLKAEDLCQIPLSRVMIVGDNDIIYGTHTIVDHKPIEPNDLEFNFVCTKIISPSPHFTLFSQDMLMHDEIISRREYTLYIEWGFAQTSLSYNQLSDNLKALMADYSSPHDCVSMGIDPRLAVPNQKHHQYYSYKKNLLNPENKEFLNEIFSCLGLNADTTFDQFAKKFGGLTLEEIISRMK